ncbi:MAG: ABC transporter ATP-binding protein [Deltaproteobacteria bacterium]|nr:ABC transporter ATP-binding protein [Deltaproteobacteria bacterium]
MITVHEVSKRFGSVLALDRVSLRIAPGERVAIVGTNGSGKTTLLRAMIGLLGVEGRVEIDGVDVAREPDRALASVAYAPQIAPPLDAAVDELVRLQGELRGVSRAAVVVRAARLGLDLDAVGKKRFRDLSGGMKQKVLAALALATDAPVLVCDEPTANLDAHARAAFFAQVEERGRGAIVVLCSHRVDEVRHLVDRVVELREGKLVRDASIAELLGELRSTRIEIKAPHPEAEGGAPLAAWLHDRGFVCITPGRWSGTFRQDEKLELVSDLMRRFEPQVADLSIFDDGEVTGFGADERRRVVS